MLFYVIVCYTTCCDVVVCYAVESVHTTNDHVCMDVCVCTYVCVYIYIYIYIYQGERAVERERESMCIYTDIRIHTCVYVRCMCIEGMCVYT